MAFESVGLIPEDGSPAAYALVGMAAVVSPWLMRKIPDMTVRDAGPKRRSRYS